MTKPERLSSKLHRLLRVDTDSEMPFNKITRNCAVITQEFAHLLLHYPIMLTKSRQTGRFTCVAVFGFDEGENLFIEEGQWQALYIPLNVQREPLLIGSQPPASGADEERMVFIDMADSRVQEDHGTPLFDGNGAPSPYLHRGTAMLKTLADGLASTQAFIDILLELQLVVPAELRFEFTNNEQRRIEGLYTIDREHLQALPPQTVQRLNSSGQLEWIYAMIASLGQFHRLVARKNKALSKALACV